MLRKSGTSGSGRGRRKRTHHGHLVGGLLHCTPGSGSGPGKRNHRIQSRRRIFVALVVEVGRSVLDFEAGIIPDFRNGNILWPAVVGRPLWSHGMVVNRAFVRFHERCGVNAVVNEGGRPASERRR